MELQIKKVKINAKGIPEVDYVEVRPDGKNPKISHEGTGVAHDDFINSLDAFKPHYALLTGYASFAKGLNIEALKTGVGNFHVSGFSIGGKDEDEGIVFTGHVIVNASGKAVIVNSPFTRFNEDEGTRYKFMDNLIEALTIANTEAKSYVVDGKFKPEVQQSLDFPENEHSGTTVSEGGEISEEQTN